MFLCRVTGTLVATRKQPAFSPAKLLIVHPIDPAGDLIGRKDLLALDPHFGAGEGDVVLVAREGSAVRQLMGGEAVPANVVILGVVDDWSYDA